MKVDLHLHTKERSSCSIAPEREQILSAIKHGLDAIFITDHDVNIPQSHIKDLNRQYPELKIFSGIEIRTADYGEDVLVLGLHDDVLEQRKWCYEELYEFVQAKNGYIALCHPYRYANDVKLNIEKYIPDAIELHSTNIGRCDEQIIRALAERLGTQLIANSDSHSVETTGIYCNELYEPAETEREIIACLKAGNYTLCADDARIARYNAAVKKREDIVKAMIRDNKTADDYARETGNWSGQFDRVMMGRSYEI